MEEYSKEEGVMAPLTDISSHLTNKHHGLADGLEGGAFEYVKSSEKTLNVTSIAKISQHYFVIYILRITI